MTDIIATRAMVRADLAAVSTILDGTGLFPATMLPDMAEPFLSGQAPHIWVVACADTAVLGFAYCEPERMTDGTYNLLAIAVDPDRQGRGVGQVLVGAIERAVRDARGRILLVETSSLPEYDRTRRFYEQLAFDREAVVREFYTIGEDKIIFWKTV